MRLFHNFIFFLCSAFAAFAHSPNTYHFIENQGQWPSQVQYGVALENGFLFLEKHALTFSFYDYSALSELHAKPTLTQEEILLKQHHYRIEFKNAMAHTQVLGRSKNDFYYNYFKGKKKHWAGGVPTFNKVLYQNIYDKIDLVFYEHQGVLKYDFIVHQNANATDIQMLYKGVDHLKIKNDELHTFTSIGKTIDERPIAFLTDEHSKSIEVSYKLKDNTLSFDLASSNHSVTIDPSLIFASYSGSTADNFGMTATYDSEGHLYSGGMAFGIGYPTTLGAFQTTFANGNNNELSDVVISKYAPDGSTLIYSTYLGGNGTETVHSMIVNEDDELYIYGATSSTDFATTSSAYQSTHMGGSTVDFPSNGTNFVGGTDMYVSKFNAFGNALLASTYLGGSANDGINYNFISPTLYDSLTYNYGDQFRGEIMLDENDDCYIISTTRSNDFPIVNGFDATYNGSSDAIVVKLNTQLSNIIWSTYLGGSSKDAGYSIKLDNSNNVVVCGGTSSSDFPSSASAINSTYQGGIADGFVTKIAANGSSFLNSSFIGTASYDQCFFIETDKFDGIYLLGQSLGSMPVSPGLYNNANSKQFIQKLNSNLSTATYSSVFGNGNGNVNFSPSAFLVDDCQNVYISGWGGNILSNTQSMIGMPVTPGAFQVSSTNGYNFYFAVFERDLNSLLYGSYFGGAQSREHVDGGTSRFDKRGVIYQSVCAGCGGNSDFPTSGAVVSNVNNSDNCNNGVFKFDFETVVTAIFSASDTTVCGPTQIQLTNQSEGAHIYAWDFGNGSTSVGTQDTLVLYSAVGTYTISLVATDTICDISDTMLLTLEVNPPIQYTPVGDQTFCLNDLVSFSASITGGQNPEFLWSLNPNLIIGQQGPTSIWATGSESFDVYLKITDGACELIDTVRAIYDSIEVNFSTTPPTCDSCNGSITANTIETLSYLWNTNNTSNQISNLCVGNYLVTIEDQSGCTELFEFDLENPDPIVIQAQVDSILCHNDCNGAIQTSISGGSAPYTLSWSNASNQALISNLCAGSYTLSVSDANNCSLDSVFILENPTALNLSIDFSDSTCAFDCAGYITALASGATPPYSYSTNNGAFQNDAAFNDLCPDNYQTIVQDNNGCTDTAFATIDSTSFEAFALNLSANPDTIQAFTSTTLLANPQETADFTWIYDFQDPSLLSQSVELDQTTSFTFRATDPTDEGCFFDSSITVVVISYICNDSSVFVPNAFTPNNDNENDELWVRGRLLSDLYFVIYNRWGEKVFETTDQNIGWNGTYKGKESDAGVFDYYLQVTCPTEEKAFIKGNITLIR